MEVELSVWSAFFVACGGGLIGELLSVYAFRKEKDLPEHLKLVSFWVITLLMVVAGGALAATYVSSGQMLSPYLALHVGISAPVILTGLVNRAPAVEPGKGK